MAEVIDNKRNTRWRRATTSAQMVLMDRSKRRKAIIILLVIILLIAGIAWLISYKTNNTHVYTAKPTHPNAVLYGFSYSKLDEYKLPGPASGSGMTFSKPQEFIAPNTYTGESLVNMPQAVDINGVRSYIGHVGVLAVYAKPNLSKDSLSSMNAAILNPNNPKHKESLYPIKNFLGLNALPSYVATLGAAKNLNTSNIKSAAWIVDFTAKANTTAKSKSRIPALKGQAVYAIGKNGYYYLAIDCADYNWDFNKVTFQKVVNSLKIDQ